jgi:hypothetical protein
MVSSLAPELDSVLNLRLTMTRERIGGEKQILSAFLDQQRDVVLWELAGLSDDQLREPIIPSGLYLLGLVKHLATGE